MSSEERTDNYLRLLSEALSWHSASLPKVAGDAAILVAPYNVEALAPVMPLVLKQPPLAATMREKDLVRAAPFSWARTARETVAVYERVLGGGEG